MPFAFLAYTWVQVLWMAFSVFWVIRRRDELPLIVSVFLFYIFSFRFWALLQGWASPTNISNFGFENPSLEALLDVDGLVVLGQSVFLLAYFFTQTQRIDVPKSVLPQGLASAVRLEVFVGICICIPLAVITRASVAAQAAAGRSSAFEVSNYLNLFPLALVGFAILLGALWRGGAFGDFFSGLFATVSVCAVAALTFQPSLRFQFLGWVLAVTVIVSSGRSVKRKAILLVIGLSLAAGSFAVQGALRNADDPEDEQDLGASAWERFAFAQDANMLDGFVLLRQVYPNLLNYSYGGEHLEILQRMIPRAWWPNKPVGGYMNKLGIIDVRTGFTLGISPSLFGSFYQEGAVYGLILLSALYGYGFGRLVKYSAQVIPFAGLVIRGCACAALIPLLRGGDLPGIYAWFGMSFWPVLLVFWWHRKTLLPRTSPSTQVQVAT
jgi:hypothetical protein